MKSSLSRIMLCCLALLVLLTAPVAMHINLPGDMDAVRVAVSMRNDNLTQVIAILTFIGSSVPALLTCTVLSTADWLRATRNAKLDLRQAMQFRHLWHSVYPLMAYVGALVTNIVLRILIGRLRPEVDYIPHIYPELQADFQRFSYPSGHAGATLVTFVALILILWRYRRVRWLALIVCVLIIAGVGFGRVYLGVHWTSDVLAGYLIGAIWLTFALHLSQLTWLRKTG